MQVAKLTAVQAAIINNARNASSKDERQQIKREVFANVKHKFGIAQNVKVKANTKGTDQKGYLILHAAGKRNPQAGQAFQLGDDGKFNGTMVTHAQLFPPPVVAAPAPAASVFGGAQSGGWFRLDPTVVGQVLNGGLTEVVATRDDVPADGSGGVTDLPTPHLFLNGRTDLAIVSDGSIYRKQAGA